MPDQAADQNPPIVNSDLLDHVISNALFTAGDAVIDAKRDGQVRVPADSTRIAVRAAIRNAVGNGALQLTPQAEQPEWWRLGDPDTWDDDDAA